MWNRLLALTIIAGLAAFGLVDDNTLAAPNDLTADAVFCQNGSFVSDVANLGGISPASCSSPTGIVVDPSGNVYLADGANSRVLLYLDPLTTDFAADKVFGQADFTGGACNQGAGQGNPTASSLCEPITLLLDPNVDALWVEDHVNGRFLAYLDPLGGDTVADLVLGQPDFATAVCGVTAAQVCSASGIAIDPDGNVYAGDSNSSRILRFDDPFTTDAVADAVFAQGGSFTSNVCNLGGISASSLCNGGHPSLRANGDELWLFTEDFNNNRVLGYRNPLEDDVADIVFGQNGNFTTNGCNVLDGPSAICQPTTTAIDVSGNLYVGDRHSRVLRYSAPLATNTIADLVVGQASFESTGCNNPVLGAGSLCGPLQYNLATAFDAAGNLYITDEGNNRVLVYTAPFVDSDADGCSDAEEDGSGHVSGGQRNKFDYWDFYDIGAGSPVAYGKDKVVDLKDVLVVLDHFGDGYNGGAYVHPEDNDLDRYVPNAAEPWRSAEANNGIDLVDALANLKSFGDSCVAAP